MNQEQYTQELASEVVRVLDQGARELDGATVARLQAGRRLALAGADSHVAGQSALAWARQHGWRPMALAATLAGMAWLFMQGPALQPTQAPTAAEDEVDLLLLTEGLPPQAYADWSLVQQDHLGPQCLAAN